MTRTVRGLMVAGMVFATASVAIAAPAGGYNQARTGKVDKAGASGISGFAVVDSDATLNRKLNAKSVAHDGVGSYIVRFNSNIRKCAYTGNVGLSGSSGVSSPGYVTVVGAGVDVKGVYVQTFDSSGTVTDLGFQLVVTC